MRVDLYSLARRIPECLLIDQRRFNSLLRQLEQNLHRQNPIGNRADRLAEDIARSIERRGFRAGICPGQHLR